MLRFHGKLALRAPLILWTSTERYISAVGVLVAILFFFNRQLGEFAMSAWEGISQWWASVPVVLLFLYGLMKANYEAFQKVEAERDELQAERQTEEQRVAIAGGLQHLYRDGRSLKAGIINSDDESPTSEWKEKFEEWRESVFGYLRTNVSAGRAEYVDGVTSVSAAFISGMKSSATRDGKETIVLHLDERLNRLAEVLKEY